MGARRRAVSGLSYLALARGLPRPTPDQCDAFARGMSGKHSWYKHVPVVPAVPFRFLIAPRAPDSSEYGSRLMDQRTVHVRSAAAHEQTFGFWDCLAPYAMGMGLSAEHRAEAEAARGFWVLAADGITRIEVPDELVIAGTVRVNAFVDPRCARLSPQLWLREDYGARAYLITLGIDPPADRAALRAVWEATITKDHLAEVRARTLAAMVDAMARVVAMIWDAPVSG